MHNPEQSDGTCYLLRMPLELREAIYRQVLDKRWVPLGEWKLEGRPMPLVNSNEESHDSNFLTEDREAIYRQVLDKRWVPFGEWKLEGRPMPLVNSNEESHDSNFLTEDQPSMDDFLPRTNAESYSYQGISSIEQAGTMANEADQETDEEMSIEEVRVCKKEGESEQTAEVLDKEMESKEDGHVLAPATSTRHDRRTIERAFLLTILRTCRQIYAEALPLLYSMVEVIITPEEVVDLHVKEEIIKRSADMKRTRPDLLRHFRNPDYKEGIFETLGLASLFDFAAFSRVNFIYFHADYNFLLIKDSPSLYIDEDLETCPNDEAELISFMKRTRTVENFVSLLATLPRLYELRFALGVKVKARMDLALYDDGGDGLDFFKKGIARVRATELFLECGILGPLRKLSNVQHFDLEVQTDAPGTLIDDPGLMVLKPEHARMARELKEAIEHNWVARNSIR